MTWDVDEPYLTMVILIVCSLVVGLLRAQTWGGLLRRTSKCTWVLFNSRMIHRWRISSKWPILWYYSSANSGFDVIIMCEGKELWNLGRRGKKGMTQCEVSKILKAAISTGFNLLLQLNLIEAWRHTLLWQNPLWKSLWTSSTTLLLRLVQTRMCSINAP